MKVIPATYDLVVELTEKEQRASDFFDDLLDRGFTVLEAAARVEECYKASELEAAFYRWLRGETP